jgi:hypothetical protein
MDANGCIQFPISTPTGLQQCNIATGLVVNNSSIIVQGNGSELDYTGINSGVMAGSGYPSISIRNLLVDANSISGTPNIFNLDGFDYFHLQNVLDEGGGPSGYFFVNSPSALSSNVVFDSSWGEGQSTISATSISMLNTNLGYGGGGTTIIAGQYFSMISSTNAGPLILATGSASFEADDAYSLNLGTALLNVTGSIEIGGPSTIAGSSKAGQLCVFFPGTLPNFPQCFIFGPTTPGIVYSHAATQLAACSSTAIGTAWVSDATSLTPGTAYSVSAGAGAITVQVQCTHSGGTYAWQTM